MTLHKYHLQVDAILLAESLEEAAEKVVERFSILAQGVYTPSKLFESSKIFYLMEEDSDTANSDGVADLHTGSLDSTDRH